MIRAVVLGLSTALFVGVVLDLGHLAGLVAGEVVAVAVALWGPRRK